ncbi:MAG: rod shape-determining protein RodA [Calditrichaeota bacterium]|nr:rod shape-determining protein RodA [Calditrichota bacterium]
MSERIGRSGKIALLDRWLLIATFLLTGIGLLLIYSADHALGNSSHFDKQLLFAGVGLGLMLMLALTPLRLYYVWSVAFYLLMLAALLFVDIAGDEHLGARRWLSIGGFSLQPSEPAKLAMIIMAARLLGQLRHDELGWKSLVLLFVVMFPPLMLVMAQPDLGTSTVFVATSVSILGWSGLPMWYFLVAALPFISLFAATLPYISLPLVAVGFALLWRSGMKWVGTILMVGLCVAAAFAAPMAWNRLEPYQQKRLTTFLDPEADPLGSGYQVIQSKVAVGSGGIFGSGYLKGTQTQLRFLPQQHTDFIFALAGEEFGLLGTTTVMLLILIYGWRGLRIAWRARTQFAALVAVGMTGLVAYHAVINIGMALGMLPVTGLPLPFLSYGGSFLLTCLAATGVLLSVGVHRRE